jgi:hypothetical protein
MANIRDCALSLLAAHDLRRGDLISDDDHDGIVGRVRRDIHKAGGVRALEAEGRRRRVQRGGFTPAGYSGDYVNTQHADNNPFATPDEENLNWHGHAGRFYPVGSYAGGSDARHSADHAGGYTLSAQQRHDLPPSDFVYPEREGYPIEDEGHARSALSRVSQHGTPAEKKKVRAAVHKRYPDMGGYAGAAANPMGPMHERFADLRGIHSQTHAGGYASDEDQRPVMVHETHRVYSTDLPLGRLFENAPGVSDATVQRLRNALLGMMDSR